MSSVNKVLLVGRIGKDPETRSFESGTAVANFSIATSERYKNSKGEKVEDTEWHNIAAWGKLGGIVSQYMSKGDLVSVQGKIKTRSYETDKGEKRYVTEIIADEITILKSVKKSTSGGGQEQNVPAETFVADQSGSDDLPF